MSTDLIEVLRAHLQPVADDTVATEVARRVGDAEVVLIGEATHGTHEFYAWRAAITRRLIEQHGFTVLALEADWPDTARLHRWVRRDTHMMETLEALRAHLRRQGRGARTSCGRTTRTSATPGPRNSARWASSISGSSCVNSTTGAPAW